MILQDLYDKKLIRCPEWLLTNTHYLTQTGSVAYGVSSDTSDMDLYGFAIPRKEVTFPHLAGVIFVPIKDDYKVGFGDKPEIFAQWIQHGIVDKDALAGKGREYDFNIFNIVKFFSLLLECNPGVLETLYTAHECVVHSTYIGNLVREHRDIFLYKKCYATFKNYAYSQLHKMTSKNPTGKRKEIRDKFGFDVKFCYNLLRLLNECEQILMTGTMDLRLNNEQLKAIRRGELKEEEVRKMASDKEKQLETLFVNSKLPEKPQKDKIKKLLLECLDYHYGTLKDCIEMPDKYRSIVNEIKDLINKSSA